MPIHWQVASRLGTCRAEKGQITFARGLLFIMSKAKSFVGEKILPLPRDSEEFPLTVLKQVVRF